MCLDKRGGGVRTFRAMRTGGGNGLHGDDFAGGFEWGHLCHPANPKAPTPTRVPRHAHPCSPWGVRKMCKWTRH